MSRICLIAISAFAMLVPAAAEAQWARTGRPVQRFDRWLGIGQGAGYHWRNPGPDSSYYNPYSSLNSGLVAPHHSFSGAPTDMSGYSGHGSTTYGYHDFHPQYGDSQSTGGFHAPGANRPVQSPSPADPSRKPAASDVSPEELPIGERGPATENGLPENGGARRPVDQNGGSARSRFRTPSQPAAFQPTSAQRVKAGSASSPAQSAEAGPAIEDQQKLLQLDSDW